jgi:predicted CxxxxCH...CXXCH cytochrome family protein
MGHWAVAVILGLLLAAGAGCDDGDADGDADADADVDADGDADVDADVDADGDADVDADRDADEERDLIRCGAGTEACGTCHGTSAGSPAPPPDTSGLDDPAELTVGAHEAHLAGSDMHGPVACTECHEVPAAVLDEGHCDSASPAEVEFGSVATGGGTFPLWDREENGCSMVYCHGATLEGGSDPRPSWAGGAPMECGSCHRRSYHGQTACDCHGHVWAGGEIARPDLHGNGRLDM